MIGSAFLAATLSLRRLRRLRRLCLQAAVGRSQQWVLLVRVFNPQRALRSNRLSRDTT